MSDFAPEVGPDGRARPRYGEYATPEEQRARIQQPDATWALEQGQVVDAEPASQPSTPPAAASVASGSTEPRPRRADRIATWALLGYGLFSVVTRLAAFLDYSTFAQQVFDILGVDATLSDPAGAQAWGIAAAAVLCVGWLLTALVSWASLRAGRITWWIPLVGGIVVNLMAGYLLTVPLMNDPAVWSALEKAMLGG